jgi:hypothetical protein
MVDDDQYESIIKLVFMIIRHLYLLLTRSRTFSGRITLQNDRPKLRKNSCSSVVGLGNPGSDPLSLVSCVLSRRTACHAR